MAVSIMQLPTDISQEKLYLKMGGDGKPVSLEMEGKVLPLDISPVDPKDPHVQELGKWAVEEHNRKTGQKLVFVHVYGGWKAEVPPTDGGRKGEVFMGAAVLYDLYLVAKHHGVPKNYEAVLLEYLDTKTTVTANIIYSRILLLFREIMIKN